MNAKLAVSLAAVIFTTSAQNLIVFSAEAQTPIEQCQLLDLPGSYLVTANLSIPAVPPPSPTAPPNIPTASLADCLVVLHDDITIDLGGWTISGPGPGVTANGFGITDNGSARTGIVVRNGTITGFTHGIFLALSTSVRVEHLQVLGNSEFGIAAGHNSIIKDNLVVGNGGSGIATSTAALVINNVAAQNGQMGIGVQEHSLVSGNIATGNDIGIGAGCPANIIGNTATGNNRNFSIFPPSACNTNTNNVPTTSF